MIYAGRILIPVPQTLLKGEEKSPRPVKYDANHFNNTPIRC
nr:MAG TPA: hypothetical protein [Caudoviricetes sp.]